MVRGNNVLPNAHFHKNWQRYVKTRFDQPAKKSARRKVRKQKLLSNRPIGLLRPVIHPPTQRYNIKLRFGRGFTLEELKTAGISKKVARTIGISVDHRRKNRCYESLNENVNRLQEYKNRLGVRPRRAKRYKKGFGGAPNEEDLEGIIPVKGFMKHLFPVPKEAPRVTIAKIEEKDRVKNAFEVLQAARKPKKQD